MVTIKITLGPQKDAEKGTTKGWGGDTRRGRFTVQCCREPTQKELTVVEVDRPG